MLGPVSPPLPSALSAKLATPAFSGPAVWRPQELDQLLRAWNAAALGPRRRRRLCVGKAVRLAVWKMIAAGILGSGAERAETQPRNKARPRVCDPQSLPLSSKLRFAAGP